MGVCSYLFVTQSLSHNHEVDRESIKLVDATGGDPNSKEIQGTLLVNSSGPKSSKGHRHAFVIPAGSNVGTTVDTRDREELAGAARSLAALAEEHPPAWDEELARKTFVSILEIIEPPKVKVADGQIPPDDPVVATYRRRLSSVVLS